jgi:GNAT superfamily N-acetyltransferase
LHLRSRPNHFNSRSFVVGSSTPNLPLPPIYYQLLTYQLMIRIATPADAAAIAALHTLNWQTSYRGTLTDHYLDHEAATERLQVWTDRFARPNSTLQTAVAETEDGELMGFVCVSPNHSEENGHLLDNLHVHATFRGLGLGKKLMRYAALWLLRTDHHGDFFLWVLTSNLLAIGFYEKLGGRPGRTEVHTFHGDQPVKAMMISWQVIELAASSKPD